MPAANHSLTIRFSLLNDQTYRVQLAGPTSGDFVGTFTAPYDTGTWSAILQALAPDFHFASASLKTQAALEPLGDLTNLMRTVGAALAHALLVSSEVAAGLDVALTIAAADRQPLAVEMRFAQGCDAVAALPWELLYFRDRFLLADTSIALSRYPEDAVPPTLLLAVLPLRVLLVLPEALDAPPVLSHEARAALMHGLRTLDEAGAVIVDLLCPPTFATLVEAVTNGGYQVLVFYGHGAHELAEGGKLLFEDEFGGQAPVQAKDLAAALRNTPVRMVLLGACESAVVGGDDAHTADVWSGTAPALIRAGVPLAIGMQTTMRVDAALTFMRQFALSLAGGQPVINAVADARRPLVVEQYGGAWFIPTLYGRPAPDYRLFDPAQPLPTATAELRTIMQGQRAEIERLEEAVRRLGVVGQPEEIAGLRLARAVMAQTRAELARRTPGGYAVITSPLYGVPSNPIFVGRTDEVRDCGRKLKNTHPVVIWGAGGIGKTALAAEVVHRQGWRFPAGVLWLDCRGGLALDTLLDRIGAFAGIAGIAQIEPAKKLPTVRYALAGLEDRCLLVWDNAEDVWGERSVREFVQGLPANCQVLLTTRDNPEVPMWQVLELRPLSEQTMMLLFGRLAVSVGVKVGTPEDLDIIPPMLEWLEGHPLAVTLVVPLVSKRGLRRVWEELRLQPLKGVAAAFEVSYGRLTAVQQQVFTRASVYTIPVQWETIEALLPGEGDVDEALDVLVQRALVAFDGSVYSYHTLLRQYAYAKLQTNEDIRPVHRLAAKYLQSLDTKRARIPAEILEEVDQWERAEAWGEFISRADSLVGTLDRIGFWIEIQSRLERVLVVVREHLGAPPDLHGYVLSGLATIHLKQADWSAAERLWQEALVLYQTANDEAGQAQTLGDLGTAYADRGNWDRAIELYQQSLVICRRQGDSECIAKILGNLGNVWTDKGEWNRAIKCYRQSLAAKQRINDDQGIATTLGNLGNVYLLKGEWIRSIKYYQQSLHAKEQLDDIRGIAQTCNNLGVVYSDMGKWDRATKYHQRSFVIYKQLGDSRGIAWTYDKIGSMYADREDMESAIKCYQQALIIEERLGDIQGIATTYNNLGNVHFQMGDLDRAFQFHQQSLAIKEYLGDTRGIAESYHNLGLVYDDKRDYDRAIEFYQKGLAICEELGDSYGRAQTLVNLGGVYFQNGEWGRAVESYQYSISTFERMSDVPSMAKAHQNLANVYWKQGKKDEAISLVAQSYLVFVQLGLVNDARKASGALVEWLGSVEATNAYMTQLRESISQQQ